MEMKAGAHIRAVLFLVLAVAVNTGAVDTKMPDLKGSRILMVVASRDFRDEEFAEPHLLFVRCGAQVTVASSTTNEVKGSFGRKVKPDITVAKADAADYDCVLFVGGAGSQEYFNDPTALDLARAAAGNGKMVCAICIAPVILANAGLLQGKKATCFPSAKGALEKGGAQVVETKVASDGLIVTAAGPEAAAEFAMRIAEALVTLKGSRTKGEIRR